MYYYYPRLDYSPPREQFFKFQKLWEMLGQFSAYIGIKTAYFCEAMRSSSLITI